MNDIYLDVNKIDTRNGRQDFFTSFFFTRLTSKGTEVCQIQYFYEFFATFSLICTV